MRRAILAILFVMSGVGFLALPSGADSSTSTSGIVLSFDFSDNSSAASVSNGTFNIITDVLPSHTGGVVRMVATPPDNSNSANLVCPYQSVQGSQVECAFKFNSNGVWTIKSQFAPDRSSDISSVSITRLRVAN